MRLESMHHVQLGMPAGGEDKAREFYAHVLGIPERPKPAPLAVRGGCWFEDGGVRVHLGVEEEFRPAAKAHPAFVVEDLEALAARLILAGAQVTRPDDADGFARLHAQDPFGNKLEFLAPH